ncbi:MAG: NAD(P)/FAD-dependent oxidoreductase [Steroidobacteraceae bacterium]
MSQRIAVVGAGMAGLAAAFRLQQAGFEVTVFECEDQVGGRTRGIQKGGFGLDLGALILSPAYKETIALLQDAGRGDLLQTIRPVLAIARDGRAQEIDLQNPLASLRNLKLLSTGSTLRMMRMLPRLLRYWSRADFDDTTKMAALDTESCRDYALRVLGEEAHDYVADPLIRLNMFTSTDVTSALDLIWLLKIFAGTSIVQVRGGMGQLSQAVATKLNVRLNARVLQATRENDAVTIRLESGATERFDAAVIAVPPPIAVSICAPDRAEQRDWFSKVDPARSLSVYAGLSQRPATRAAVILVPSREHPHLMSIILDHNKAPERLPPGKGVIAVHMNGAWRDAHQGEPDERLAELALRAAAPFVGDVWSDVETWHVQRWDYVDHVRYVGSYKRLAAANFLQQEGPIVYAGEYTSGGVEGAAVSGSRCARMLARTLRG